jgi:hypothetical protein
MSLIFADRKPTHQEFERFRLIFSTYQDGTGMLARHGSTLPGWRDFERSVAYAFRGIATESKNIYDVLFSAGDESYMGVSCKMRKTLRKVRKDGRVTIEVSNAAGAFWDELKANDINEENIHHNARESGKILIDLVHKWHDDASIENGGVVNTDISFYLALQWDEKTLTYQMFQFPLHFPKFYQFQWQVDGRRLVGFDETGVMFEWYLFSGGQFKYYPFSHQAVWQSQEFMLEPLPTDIEYGIVNKAKVYFPELWTKLVGG